MVTLKFALVEMLSKKLCALLVNVPVCVGVTTIVATSLPPDRRLANGHVTVLALLVQVPPGFWLAETNCTLGGRLSTIASVVFTLVKLDSVTVKVSCRPVLTVVGLAVLLIQA